MNISDFIAKTFEIARENGLEKYEAYSASGENFRVGVFNGTVDEYQVTASCGVSFRVELNGKMGYASTERLDEESARFLVKKAMENARVIEKEDREFMFHGGEYAKVEGYYPELDSVSAEKKIAYALKMDEVAHAAPAVRSVTPCKFMSFSSHVEIANSLGLNVSFDSNGMGGYVGVAVQDGDRVHTAMDAKFTFRADEFCPEEVAKKAVEKGTRKVGAATMPSGAYPALLNPEVASDFLSTFSSVFSAEAAQKGMSLLKDKVGETVAAEIVSLVDDPHRKNGFASRPFDDEGVPTYYKEVIENGKLTTLLHNLKTAHKAGVQSTGNAAKASISSPVKVAASNFYIKPGTLGFEELLAKAGNGIYITEVEGLHAGADAVSGDFSLSARGFIIEEGKLGRPVDGITVAGNFYTLLMDIIALGADLEFGFPSGECTGAPTLLIKKLNIAGE